MQRAPVRAADSAWVATWASAQQLTEPRNLPPAPGLRGATLRQVVHVSVGGTRLRLHLSNAFGDGPLVVAGARVARSLGGKAVAAGGRVVSFNGRPGVTIPAGGSAVSDPVAFDVSPLTDLAVSLAVTEAPAAVTGHPGSRTTSYLQAGDATAADSMPGAARPEHWYLLSEIDVPRAAAARGTVVVLGNSIADGRGSGTNKQNRWPDNLARRLQGDARTRGVAVVNQGIGGNCVLRACLGPAAVDRFQRDVLDQPGARWLIVSEGVNDIGGTRTPEQAAGVADSLIAAYGRMIALAHGHGMRAYGATILPFGGAQYDSPDHERARQRVNAWVRTSGAFDAVLDLDAAMRDSAQPARLRADVDGGDHLHPNEAGYRVMAGAIDLGLFAGRATGAVPARGAAAGGAPNDGGLHLARLFSAGAVLQRGVPIPVWGTAGARTPVTVTFHGHTARATADAAGRWRAVLPAERAGGPYALNVTSGEQRAGAADVLVGDVWVASGQSNMELPVSAAANAAQEIAAAHDSSVRMFTVPDSWNVEPQDELAGGAWAPADPQHVGKFSAVAYYFARALRPEVGVPLGVVHTSWGGSNIETWTSARGLGMSDSARRAAVARERAYPDSVRAALTARFGPLPATDAGTVDGRAVWADPALDDKAWASMPVPAYWEMNGYAGLDGVAWYRTTVTLTADEARRAAALALGPVDDDDRTWVNGVEVGQTTGYAAPRRYAIPAGTLREGANVIAVRVVDAGGNGGIAGSGGDGVYLDLGGVRKSLAGPWRFKVGALRLGFDGQRINKLPSVLYNAMLHPLLPMAMRGVIWYQGESNANNDAQAAAYRGLFAGLIRSWRAEWGGGHPASGSTAGARSSGGPFPFLWVQLPNYGALDSAPPARAGWATLRESQAAALTLPNTGQAVAIDLGAPGELHPKNKQDVGRRLALVARRVAYGQPVVASGPTLRAHAVRGDSVVLTFGDVGGGLVSHGAQGTAANGAGGFAVAGADRRWAWAEARVEGDRVVVWSPRVTKPVAARYAWANSPRDAGLYNRDGLPAAPFRTDAW